MRKFLIAAIAAAVIAGGCSGYNDERGRGDAPIGDRDDSPADVVFMPDKFANVAIKCYGTNGIYETTREAAPFVVVDDPMCKNGGG